MKKSIANGIRKLENISFYLLILLLPTQLGKHFWPDFSSVMGIRVDYLSPTIYLTDLIVGLLFIAWLLNINPKSEYLNPKQHQNKKNKSPKHFEHLRFENLNLFSISNLVFQIFIFYLLINVFLSGRIAGGLYSLLKFLEMSFVAYYTAKFIDLKNNFPRIITMLSIGAIAESAIAIFQYVLQGSIGGVLYYLGERTFNASTPGIANASLSGELVLRPYGTFPHPNVLAGFLVVAMTLILGFLLNSKRHCEAMKWLRQFRSIRRVKRACFVLLAMTTALILGTLALFLSMSRVAIVLWALIIGYFFIRNMKKKIYIFVILGISLIFMSSPIGSRFTNIKIGDEAIVQREVLISSSLKMIERSPLFGVGLGNFIPTIATIQKPLSLGLYLQPVHNIFLLVTAETGLVGLGFFTWFLWKTYQGIMKQESRIKEMLVMALTSILILGLFDHYWLTLQQGQLLFAIIIGLCYNPSQYGRTTG